MVDIADRLDSILGMPVDRAIQVDKNDLDTAWEQQTALVWNVNEALTTANRERDEAKRDAEIVDGDLLAEYTAPPEGGGRPMAIDKAKAQAASSRESKRAWAAYAEAKEFADKLAALAIALQARQSSLKHLSELYEAGYYVSDRSRNNAGAREKVAKQLAGRRGKED